MGISKRFLFRQRAAVLVQGSGKSRPNTSRSGLPEIAVGEDGDRPVQREVLLDTVRVWL